MQNSQIVHIWLEKRLYQALQVKNKQSTKLDRTNFVLFIVPIFEICYYSTCNPEDNFCD